MELGEKLKQARLESGLSQRQLCGDTITRNMLSLIENGAARPSMDTLTVLAARLGKPVESCIFVDDNIGAISTAKQAGMLAVGVYDASSADCVAEMTAAADIYIYDFSELSKIE